MKMIHNELAELADIGHYTFVQKVKLLLSYYGFDVNQLIGATHREIKQFELSFRENLFARFIQKWSQNLHFFPKWVTYREMKTDYIIEPYILYIPNKRHQQVVARLRVSSHNLNIEIGRHSRTRIPRDQRFWMFCNSGKIDDGLHFITACHYHSCERDTFFRIVDLIIKISGFANTFDEFAKALGSFDFSAFKKRDTYMNQSVNRNAFYYKFYHL